MTSNWWEYDAWDPAPESNWIQGTAHGHEHERDPHVDLGCGTIKKGRIGIDRYGAPGVNVVMDFESLAVYQVPFDPNTDALWKEEFRELKPLGWGLPFPDNSIKSIISHHCLEHVGDGFVDLIDECYRVLEPGGVLRAITPLFPSTAAVADPDHCRYFMEDTWLAFSGFPDHHSYESFSVPYTKARFTIVDTQASPRTPIEKQWTSEDVRELRVSLVANK